MRFAVEVGASVKTVIVERRGALHEVTIDGRRHVVDVRRIDPHTLSLLFALDGKDSAVRRVEAALFLGRAPNTRDVHVNGQHVLLTLRHGTAAASAAGSRPAGSGLERVLAPMPGKVTRLLVAAGDPVAPRQGLVVVEAMKMENELKAPRAGYVREVVVAPGQLVEAGAVLLTVE